MFTHTSTLHCKSIFFPAAAADLERLVLAVARREVSGWERVGIRLSAKANYQMQEYNKQEYWKTGKWQMVSFYFDIQAAADSAVQAKRTRSYAMIQCIDRKASA